MERVAEFDKVLLFKGLAVQIEFLTNALYITSDANLAPTLDAACKRCGAKKVVGCQKNIEAIDYIIKNKFEAHLVIEDVLEFSDYNFFPIKFFNSCKRFVAPPPCIALCDTGLEFSIKSLKNSHVIDYVSKPVNESFLEQRMRAIFQKTYSYHREGVLSEKVEDLLGKKQFEQAYCLLVPALARFSKSKEYLSLFSKILFEMNEFSYAELAVRYLIGNNKNDAFAKIMLTKILLKTGRVKEAEKINRNR